MKSKSPITIFACSFLVIACSKLSTNNPPPAPAPPVTDTEYCGQAQDNLIKLCQMDPKANYYCCAVSAPTALQKPFKQFCEETQNNGVFLNPKCLSTVTACDQIDKCRSGL